MPGFLNSIRPIENKLPVNRQVVNTAAVMLAGILSGVISKYLDCTASNELPFIIAYLDVRNFLGRFAVWIFLGVCISVYSASPARAAVNVFVFFTGMVVSYYLYSKWIAGFFPVRYAMIWAGFTLFSPLLAVVCWYSKGTGRIPLAISAGIVAVLFNVSFVYGWIYFDLRSPLEMLVFIGGAAAVRRATARETVVMAGLGLVLAFILNAVIPFHFG